VIHVLLGSLVELYGASVVGCGTYNVTA